jgi:hypothetical protein
VLRATAASYVISPTALAAVQPDPARSPDRLSARRLLAIDGEVRFASAADRAAFAEELATAVTSLVSRYHDETAEGGRDHRLIVAIHPSVKIQPGEPDQPGD